jgi:hypothetical protein
MITDILLLFQFFFTFIVRTTSNECTSSRSWSLFVCYFEALTNNYLNILEAYILLALNLCRYLQIAYNRNVYATHVHLLTLTHVAIYLFPVISLIIQLSVGWTSVEYRNDSCNVAYTGISIQIINVIFAFGLPISFNILVIYASIRHVHLNSRLRRAQHHVSASEKYHRSLTIQFFIFYTVWLSLWSPYIIVFQLGIGNNNILAITQLLNSIETDLDPMIIGALDVRFRKVWRDIWKSVKKKLCIQSNRNQRRIGPNTISNSLQMCHQI